MMSAVNPVLDTRLTYSPPFFPLSALADLLSASTLQHGRRAVLGGVHQRCDPLAAREVRICAIVKQQPHRLGMPAHQRGHECRDVTGSGVVCIGVLLQ
jgi:hypothetical protein